MNEALAALSGRFDGALFAHRLVLRLRPNILLRATLLQAFFTVRSERQLMEQIDQAPSAPAGSAGVSIDDAGLGDASTFSKNRDRLLEADVVAGVPGPACCRFQRSSSFRRAITSPVDGTLLKSWASMKSFRPKDGPARRLTVGETASATSAGRSVRMKPMPPRPIPMPSSIVRVPARESRLCYMGSRTGWRTGNGLAVAMRRRRLATLNVRWLSILIDRHRPSRRRITVGGDKGFDVEGFVQALRERKVTPHIAIDGHLSKTGKRRKTAIDDRTLRHVGYDISQRCRKRIEEVFGWTKTTARCGSGQGSRPGPRSGLSSPSRSWPTI